VPPQLSGQVYTTNTTSGQFLTSSGSNGMSWTTGTTTTPYDAVMTINQTKPATIEVKGNMVINGRDLEERLDTIEKVLQIPERDAILEKKHPKLKKLYNEYINELAKYRMWHAIKGDDDGTT
jgi:predicted RNA-binding protein with PIN domain